MTELFVCIGWVWGMCGAHVVEQFPTPAQCEAVLVEMRKVEKFTYGYCRLPKAKP